MNREHCVIHCLLISWVFCMSLFPPCLISRRTLWNWRWFRGEQKGGIKSIAWLRMWKWLMETGDLNWGGYPWSHAWQRGGVLGWVVGFSDVKGRTKLKILHYFCICWHSCAGKCHAAFLGCTFLLCFLLESSIILCCNLKSPGSPRSNGTTRLSNKLSLLRKPSCAPSKSPACYNEKRRMRPKCTSFHWE